MSDVFTRYELALEQLLARLGKQHPRAAEARTLQARLRENIAAARLHGDTETRRAGRSEICAALDTLAIECLDVTFNELAYSSERAVLEALGAEQAPPVLAAGERGREEAPPPTPRPDKEQPTAISPGRPYESEPPLTPAAAYEGVTETTLTWLHLSDLHWREKDTYNANVVLQALLDDLARRAEMDPGLERIDLILVTGDLAYAGKAQEYKLAQQFLDDLLHVTGVYKERLFIVPGNHDVNRKAITPLAAHAAAALDNRDKVNAFLFENSSRQDRTLVLRRLRNYYTFIKSYLGPDHPAADPAHCFYTAQLGVAGMRLAILGLNSAWLAGSEDDRHRLLLGERQVRTALESTTRADLRIALLHHPLEWLADWDRHTCEPLLLRGCQFLLHGHLHEQQSGNLRAPGIEAMVIGAGAGYETREQKNAYNLVRLDFAQGRGVLYLREYSDRPPGFWTKDVRTYPEAPDGKYGFDLPAALGPWPPRPSGRDPGGVKAAQPVERETGGMPVGAETQPGAAEPARERVDTRDLRKKDLAEHIERQYALLREYEIARDLESDPKAIARAGREITAIRDTIRTYLEEYQRLCRAQGQELPAELLELQQALRE